MGWCNYSGGEKPGGERAVKQGRSQLIGVLGWCWLAFHSASASAGETGASYSPYAGQHISRNLYWGDTHLHTNLSFDAINTGNTLLSPEQSYRFARGEEIKANNGMPVKLSKPLDFLVVSDHSEYLGIINGLVANDPVLLGTEVGGTWKKMRDSGDKIRVFERVVKAILTGEDLFADHPQVKESIWKNVTETADRFNDPGQFTAFVGYEWTSMPNGNNLHRVVIFRDGSDKAGKVVPFSAVDSAKPEQLWNYLQQYETDTGGQVLAIPHNSNVSGGLMFNTKDSEGRPFTTEYAQTRMRWEPLMEATQYKGDSETHPYLSPDDRFADYGRWDKGIMSGATLHENWMFPNEYARSALKLGLQQEALLGVNPFKFGMIGSTDSHTSLSAAEENNYWGKLSLHEPSDHRAYDKLTPRADGTGPDLKFEYQAADTIASGYAAVWAEENTRESIFAAMQRRETYATTGPRMVVRFFGGWDFDKLDHLRPDYAAIGYKKGVPMGGDLSGAAPGKSPRFLVMASKDPEGANLERIQIVKGWLDARGETHEKAYDVELSDDRKLDAQGKMAPPVKSTVDVKTATYTNKVGGAQLGAVWEDPDFNGEERAFYYVRVLEISTPRWTTYDAAFYGTKLPEGVPAEHQERAYTSPIWYTP